MWEPMRLLEDFCTEGPYNAYDVDFENTGFATDSKFESGLHHLILVRL